MSAELLRQIRKLQEEKEELQRNNALLTELLHFRKELGEIQVIQMERQVKEIEELKAYIRRKGAL